MSHPKIISGVYRGARLQVWSGSCEFGLRPTLARVRKSLFDILASRLQEPVRALEFADIFAGCGAVGLEALSVGFAKSFFLEKHPLAVRVLRKNVESLGVGDVAEVIVASAFAPPPYAKGGVGVLFFDPPYECRGVEAWSDLLTVYSEHGWIGASTEIIIQHAHAREAIENIETAGKNLGYEVSRRYDYGKHSLSFIGN